MSAASGCAMAATELAEACALYERVGFERVVPFNAEPYSGRWYSKTLSR